MLSPKHRSLIQRIGFIALAVVLVVLAFTPMFSLKTTSASMNYETQYFNLSESLTNVVERSYKKEMEAAQTADEKAAVMSKYTEIAARMIELKEGTGENVERSMVTFIKEMPKAFSLIKYVFADKILTELEKKQDEIETKRPTRLWPVNFFDAFAQLCFRGI